MNIQREKLEASFSEFAKQSGGVVIGPPGIGKTFLLKKFCEEDTEFRLYFPIDKLGVENEADLKVVLGINSSFIDYLQQKSIQENIKKGILLIDAFDAARSDTAKIFFLSLVKQVLNHLKETWTVIVSVRTFDAMKSQELQDLFSLNFGSNVPSDFQISGVYCQHFAIPLLNNEERDQAINSISNLPDLYKTASDDFKELLRIPFNLWLVEKILTTNPESNELSSVNSEIQLLGLFWKYRVLNDSFGEERRILLSKITQAMVESRSLSVRTDQVFVIGASHTWNSLLNSEVLAYTSSDEQRITFRHNILFDYAVSVLLIEDDLNEFVKFLNEDLSRPLFLRPSLNFYFTRLWHTNKDLFWRIFWAILPNTNLHVRLFARLLPPTVIINEAKGIEELKPLTDALASGENVAKEAVLRILQAYRMLQPKNLIIWVLFIEKISHNLSPEFAWDLAIVINQFLGWAKEYKVKDLEKICGLTARNLLLWVWQQRFENPNKWFDDLGAFWAVPLVAKTFWTEVESSRLLLSKIFELLKESNFPINYFYRLAEEIDNIWDYSPEFVEAIYINLLAYREISEEKTQLGTVIVPMSSTRKQDFHMCHYVLIKKYPNFLKATPLVATRAAILSLNQFIIEQHILPYNPDIESINKITEEFIFRGEQAQYISDHSYIWDSGYREEPIELADHLFPFIDGLVSAQPNIDLLNSILDEFRNSAKVAFFWKRLLESGTRAPETFANYLFDLCIAPPILLGTDTSTEVEIFIGAAAQYFTEDQRLQIERTIIDLAEDKKDEFDSLENWRNQIIARIPAELLQTEQTKRIRREMDETGNIPVTERRSGFHFSTGTYTEDMWLRDEGADLEKLENKELLAATAILDSFSSKFQNDAPSLYEVKSILEKAQNAFDLIEKIGNVDESVKELAWTRLAACATAMSRVVIDPQSEEFQFCRRVLLASSFHPSPLPNPEIDAEYSTPYWSPSPRTEAAQGLPWLAMLSPESELLDAIKRLIDDSNPSVRFLIVSELFRLIESAAEVFWDIAEHIADNEENKVVQEAFFRTLSYVAIRDEEKTTAVFDRFFKRKVKNFQEIQIWSTAIPTIVGLAIARQNSWAIETLDSFINEPVDKVSPLYSAIFNALTFIPPERVSDPKNMPIIDRAIDWLLKAIEFTSQGIKELLNNSDKQSTEELQKEIHNVYKIIDNVVLRLYFMAKIKDDMRLHDDREGISDEQREIYYFKIKPLLEQILLFALDEKKGFLFAPTAYHFMQLLNGVLRYDPKGVLHMATGVAQSSEFTGFSFDQMALTQVVKMVELILADYRYEVREGQPLEDLLALLDIFARTGSTEALQLVWRLDEVYR